MSPRRKTKRLVRVVERVVLPEKPTEPTPSELAALAVQLSGAEVARDNPRESLKTAAKFWAEARIHCEKLERAEVYRKAVLSDEACEERRGDLVEDDVMKMVQIGTRNHFQSRAMEFFEQNWKTLQISSPAGGYLKNYAENKSTLKFQTGLGGDLGPNLVPKWHRIIAECFRDWLAADKSKKAGIGGRAAHGLENSPTKTEKRPSEIDAGKIRSK